ncbi:PTS sugar transporter subunit IIB, partial [Streptococcus pneumoniae]
LGEKRNHPGSKLRQGFWMVFRLGVNNWGYREMKVDAERLGIQIVATRGMEYIHLTKSPSKSLQFVLEHYQAV